MKVLVVGDIHGNHKGLVQALQRAEFDYEKDKLISLGDLVDGHSDSYEVIEELLKIKNLITVRGNHDDWFKHWIEYGESPVDWGQGQAATGFSYLKNCLNVESKALNLLHTLRPSDIPSRHRKLFKNQLPYYKENGKLFIHGGFNRHYKLEEQLDYVFWWDRDLWSQALSYESMVNSEGLGKPKFKMVEEFDEIFIGHTSTQHWGKHVPMHAANIWNLDTGGGWFGFVTVMNVDTKEYWQNDPAKILYSNFKGR